jgi:hypothetical protein
MSNKTVNYDKINYGFSLLKMLLAFEVLLGHFAIWNEYDTILVWPFRELVSLAVPCFVMLSFYLMEKSFLARDPGKFKTRLIRLLIPQVGWAIIYYVIYLLLDTFLHTGLQSGIQDFFWQLFTGHSRNLNPSMWYQVDVIIITILFYFVFKYLDDRKGYLVLIGLTVFSYFMQLSGINMALFGDLEFELKWPLGRILEMIPFAFIGFSLKYFNILEKLKRFRYILMPLCMILFYLGFCIPWPPYKDFGFSGFAKPYLAIWIVIFAFVAPFELLPLSFKKAILKITDYSLGIYCIHRLINTLLYVFVPGITLRSFERCILLYIVCYAVCWLIEKIPNKTVKQLVN